jgi:hypothetical protein
MPELKSEQKIIDGESFVEISFENCTFTYEYNSYKVPFYATILGIPENSSPTVSILSNSYNLLNGYKLPLISNENNNQDYRPSQKNDFYPESIAKITPIGYMRQQRIARLEIYPIQYNKLTNQLKIYKKLRIRVDFSDSINHSYPTRYNDEIYEDIYKDALLNYEQAKKWRINAKNTKLAPTALQQPSGTQGLSYKIIINKNGIYRLDYYYLKSYGIDPSTIDPRKIELKTGGNDVPIYVEGYQDGKFDETDYIEFYGTKMNSIYTNDNVYWLSWATKENPNAKSWMMAVKDGNPVTPDTRKLTAYKTTERLEYDRDYDPLKKVNSETADHFFWKPFRGQDPKNNKTEPIAIELPYRAPNTISPFTLRVCFQGITYAKGASTHIMKIYLNNELLNTAQWEGPNEYISETTIRQDRIHKTNWLVIECHDKNDTRDDTDPKWDSYLNWVEVDYWREFLATNNSIEFSTETLPSVSMNSVFTVRNFTNPEIEVFQIDASKAIAKIINPKVVKEGNTYTASFEDNVTQPTRYVVVASSTIMRPKSVIKDSPSTLHDPANNIDYIIITHNKFYSSIERLAEFRRRQGLNVIIVDVDDIYDEFSYGIFDPKSIKRFLRYAYFNWAKMPTYVLLVGDAHWDYKYVYDEYYKKYPIYPLIYVPTYHGPSNPYGETAMDDRFVCVSGDDVIPDMLLGRMPVNEVEDINNVIDKTIEYETNIKYGQWQSRIMLVADDESSKSGDEVFEDSRRILAEDYIPVGYEVLDVYLRKIKQPYLAEDKIVKGINSGVLLLEYSGHGGSEYWAHENIFNMSSIKKLRNSVYPVVITTTCENGYFDNPQGGKKTLIDQFLMQAKSGSVACFSATRLTYGQGNAVFDQKLYPRLFNTNPPILGKIMNLAKIDFIKLDISAWTATVEQYTIFGDPALRIAMPELKIECELGKSSVSMAGNLDLNAGYIKRQKLDSATGNTNWLTDTNFSGQMRMSITYPNNFDDDDSNDLPVQIENTQVAKGVFQNISLAIPKNIKPGKARLRFFANNDIASAVGGIRFSISEPVIEQNISKIINDDYLQIYVAVSDDLGLAGIKSINCIWRNTETWLERITPLQPGPAPENAPKVNGVWFVLKDPIPLSKPGTKIDYRIKVIDTEANEIMSEYVSVKVPIGVNLTIPRPAIYMPPNISYSYSKDHGAWTLSVSVENSGSKELKNPVSVYFFEGNPDRNNDQTVDLDALLLGGTVIKYEHWEKQEPSEDQPIQRAVATIKLSEPLYPGFHQIFVWINPRISFNHGIALVDRVEDADEFDNIGSKLFQINEFLVGRNDSDTYAQSLDDTLDLIIPPNAIDETIMSITRLIAPISEWKQVDITHAPMPANKIDGNAFRIQVSSGIKTLNKDASIELKFDVSHLREIAKKAKGLGGKTEGQLTYTEKQWVDIAVQEEAKKLGVYLWQEELKVWKYIPSELVMADNNTEFAREYYVTLPVAENVSSATFENGTIKIDEISAPIANWAILFVDSERYKIYLRREGQKNYESLSRYGEVNVPYSNTDVGLQVTMFKGEKDYSYGDVFKFNTYRELDGSIKVLGMKAFNNGDGTVHVTIIKEDQSYINKVTGQWIIFFLDSKNFEIHTQYGSPILDDFGEVFVGTIGKELYIPSIGLNIEISEGKYPFEFADKLVFQTLFVGKVKANIKQIGTISLMHSNDIIRPNVELWVNGQIPKSGAVIPPRPSMSLMLSDVNGIDMSSFNFSVSVNDREFHQVPRSDYILSDRSQLDNIPVFYSPILNVGKYRYRISVKDFAGNISKSGNGEYLEFMFLVEEKPDLKSPVIKVIANGKELTNGDVFQKSPMFNINISDDYALEVSAIIVSIANFGKELIPLEKNEYSISISNDLKNADIIYYPQLMNGDYAIQIQAVDTSKNFAYLSPPDFEPIRFTVDEDVEVKEIINAPNPFSDRTFFSYYLTQPANKAIVKIYTIKGRLIRTLEQDSPSWKYNEIYWDGRDEDDSKVASGVYLYKFTVKTERKKIDKIGKLAVIR